MDAEDVDVEELGELILQYTEEVNALFSLLSSIHVESSVGHSPSSSFSMIFMIFMIFLLIDRIVMMTMTARKRRSSLLIFLVHSL